MRIEENGKYRDTTPEEEAQCVWDAGVPVYSELVSSYIRERYTLDAELAISRQRDTKPAEFAEYSAYCEACKERASSYIAQVEAQRGQL